MSSVESASRGCAIVTISGMHSADKDESGALVHDALIAAGHEIVHQRWFPDDLGNLRYLFREWVDDARVDVIIAIGGTGLYSRDVTPEALQHLITKPMPGFGEVFRALSFQELGVSALESRAMAAVCHATLVYLVPGAPRAVSLAMNRLIIPQLGTVPTELLRPTMMPEMRIPQNRP